MTNGASRRKCVSSPRFLFFITTGNHRRQLLTAVIDFAYQDNIRIKRAREMVDDAASVSWSTTKSFFSFVSYLLIKFLDITTTDYELSRSQTRWSGFRSLSMATASQYFYHFFNFLVFI